MTSPILSMSGQAMLFGLSVLAGAGIALGYDTLRVLRRLLRHPAWLVNVQDAIFWLAATLVLFAFLHTQGGGVRPFAVVGAVCGAVLYFATLSRLIVPVVVRLIRFLTAPFIKVFYIIVKPLRVVARYATIHKKKLAGQLHILRRKV